MDRDISLLDADTDGDDVAGEWDAEMVMDGGDAKWTVAMKGARAKHRIIFFLSSY